MDTIIGIGLFITGFIFGYVVFRISQKKDGEELDRIQNQLKETFGNLSREALSENIDTFYKLSENKFIGGVYGDDSVKEGGVLQEFYFPPHDHQTFSKLIGVFPIFFKLQAIREEPLDENLQHLYGHNTLVKISQASIVSHIPELLFSLEPREINIESDINYLKNVS